MKIQGFLKIFKKMSDLRKFFFFWLRHFKIFWHAVSHLFWYLILLIQYQEKPWLYPEDIAQLKAEDIVKQELLKNGGDKDQPIIVIGCDTVVTLNNQFYGKPKDIEDAKSTLKSFRFQSFTSILWWQISVKKWTYSILHLEYYLEGIALLRDLYF